jgi:hypothetical protein
MADLWFIVVCQYMACFVPSVFRGKFSIFFLFPIMNIQ